MEPVADDSGPRIPKVDLEDDQCGDQDVFADIHASGAMTATSLTREIVQTWRTLVNYNQQYIVSDLRLPLDTDKPTSSVAFRLPSNQRASIVVRINLPRDMKREHNPDQFEAHSVFFTIPASGVERFEYNDMPDGYTLSDATEFNPNGQGMLNNLGAVVKLGKLSVDTRVAFVTGTPIPKLLSTELHRSMTDLVASIRSSSSPSCHQTQCFEFLLRRNDTFTNYMATQFRECVTAEHQHDPAKDWIADSPNAEAFTIGTLVPVFDRPEIPRQRAETVFADKKAYLIPHIYGNLYEEEFQQAALNEMKADTFNMRCVESPIASNPQDKPEGESFESTARAYVVFIDFNDKEIVRPEIGNTLEVEILVANDESSAVEVQTQQQDTEAADGIVTSSDDQEEPIENPEGSVAASENPDVGQDIELGNEDNINVFDEDDDEDPLKKNTWIGVVVEPTDITPPGCITLVLERGREPGFKGPRSDRPFVDTPLPTVNYRISNSTAQLAEMVARGPTTAVKLSMHYSRQGFKDQVRCADQLWRSDDPQKMRISQALLAHDTDNSPLQRVDIIGLKGNSRVDMSSTLNRAQRQAHASFRDTPEITFIHGPFGTGKSLLCLSTAVEVLSNPDKKNQVLYLVDSNQAVDDATLKWDKLLKSVGMQKNIIRVHSLKGEKSRVYRYFDIQGQAQERFELSDAFLHTFASVGYLIKLSREHQAVRRRGDPRRVLDDMSLAAAMHRKLEISDESQWGALKSMLEDYGKDGFHNTEPSKRTTIKLQLNELMAQTLQAADGIATTLANAAKVNLAMNFKPVLVILDEAARVTELKTLIVFGSYSPRAFLLAADHKQMRCTILSAGKWRDPVAPYLNPFENQLLLSLFERSILAGYEHILLSVQHRCKGDIPDFVTAAFYNGRVSKSPLVPGEKKTVEDMRNFVHQKLGARVRTNLYAVNISNSRSSKEPGGTSSFNEAEISEIIKDQAIMRKDPLFKGMTFCVISFYKAQVTKLKARLREFDDVTVMDGDDFIVNLAMTVDASQGREFDVVQLSCVRTKGVAFLGEPHRLVVALTRSKWILGIYTNWDLAEVDRVTSMNKYIIALFKHLDKTNRVIDRTSTMLMTCNNCHADGHISKECPEPKAPFCRRCHQLGDTDGARDHTTKDCHHPRPMNQVTCRECGLLGHARLNCPSVICRRCKLAGHTESICPQPVLCQKCRQPGHTGRECQTVITRAYIQSIRALRRPTTPKTTTDTNAAVGSELTVSIGPIVEGTPAPATDNWDTKGAAAWDTKGAEAWDTKGAEAWDTNGAEAWDTKGAEAWDTKRAEAW